MLRRSYLDLLLVLELDARARHVEALEELREALDHEQDAGSRHDRLERPQDGPPRRLVGGLVDLEGVGSFMPTEPGERQEAREEEDDVGHRVDQPSRARRERLPEEI